MRTVSLKQRNSQTSRLFHSWSIGLTPIEPGPNLLFFHAATFIEVAARNLRWDGQKVSSNPEVACDVVGFFISKPPRRLATASKAQFMETTIEYVNSLFEVSKQRETYLPSVEEYIEGRIINIGVYPTLDLIPYEFSRLYNAIS